jgi:hypothetical protein
MACLPLRSNAQYPQKTEVLVGFLDISRDGLTNAHKTSNPLNDSNNPALVSDHIEYFVEHGNPLKGTRDYKNSWTETPDIDGGPR